MSHSHYPGITCTGPLTKKACDTLWTQFQHGHEGKPCMKDILPGNKTASCFLRYTPEELLVRLSKRADDMSQSDE